MSARKVKRPRVSKTFRTLFSAITYILSATELTKENSVSGHEFIYKRVVPL